MNGVAAGHESGWWFMIDQLIGSLGRAARSESLLVDIKMSQLLVRAVIAICLAVAAIAGLIMASAALWLALHPAFGPVWASAAVSVANFAIALALFLALRPVTRRERELVEAMSHQARSQFDADTSALMSEAKSARDTLRSDAASPAEPSLEVALARILVPAAVFLVRSLRRRTPTRRDVAVDEPHDVATP